MAGLGIKLWENEESAFPVERNKTVFRPSMDETLRQDKYEMWIRAVDRSREWSKK
jgi:glycerol kinase